MQAAVIGPHHIECGICGEETGAKGTSMENSVHKYGPTTHDFVPAAKLDAWTVKCSKCGKTFHAAVAFHSHVREFNCR